MDLHFNGQTHTWDYDISNLPLGETQLVFTVKVTAQELQADGTYAEGYVTEKKYRITIWRDLTNKKDAIPSFVPSFKTGTALEIQDVNDSLKVYSTNPTFDPDGTFYYVNLPLSLIHI